MNTAEISQTTTLHESKDCGLMAIQGGNPGDSLHPSGASLSPAPTSANRVDTTPHVDPDPSALVYITQDQPDNYPSVTDTENPGNFIPGPEQGNSSPDEYAAAANRLRLLRAVAERLQAGCSQHAAARQIGISEANLTRLKQRLESAGYELTDLLNPNINEHQAKLLEALLSGHRNSGRKSDFSHILADQAFCNKLTELYLATMGASGQNVLDGRRTAKCATALACMADEPECAPYPLLAAKLRQHLAPASLDRFLRRITPELESRIRGPKHFQLHGLLSRKDTTIRFPDGTRAEMPAGFCWVFDDMSVNQPFWTKVEDQLLFSRQGLYSIDRRSKRWLGKMLIARPREAYRAEDILRFVRALCELYGKPDCIIFERGVWHSRSIRGYRLIQDGGETSGAEEEFQRPEMTTEDTAMLSSGLEAIGIRIVYAKSAHDKIIETAFNFLQDIVAIKTREYISIGRHAGEFELGAKRLRQARAESHTPDALGFIPLVTLSDRIDHAFTHINGLLNSNQEIPDHIWAADLQRRPLLPLCERDYAVLPARERKTRNQRRPHNRSRQRFPR